VSDDGNLSERPRVSVAPPVAFALERFVWTEADRLQVCGTFAAPGDAPLDAPVLVVDDSERVHRLSAVPESISGAPGEGRWCAEFAWQETPVAFEAAHLELGPELVIDLPAPSPAKGSPSTATADDYVPSAGADRLRLEAALLEAEEEIRERRAGMEVIRNELARTRQDLKAERERHDADAERFREGLSRVRTSAEKALAAEQAATQRRASELRQAQEAVEQLREQLRSAESARGLAESDARGLRAELERVREAWSSASRDLASIRAATEEGAAVAERLLAQLSAIERDLGGDAAG
jgi:hypothetical protein